MPKSKVAMNLTPTSECYVVMCIIGGLQSPLCSIMSKQPIELLLVKIKPMSETLQHCVTHNNNTH